MSKQQEWKRELITKLQEKYGNFDDAKKERIEQLLDKHWDLCKTKCAYSFARLPALFGGVGIAANIDLRAFLPGGIFAAVVGRSAFMALSYVVTDLFSTKILPAVVPALDTLTKEHLTALFKKADDFDSLVKVLGNINLDIERTIKEDKQAHAISAVGIFAGHVLNCVPLGNNAPIVAKRGLQWGAVVASTVFPTLHNPRHKMYGTPVEWPRTLSESDAKEAGEQKEGVRRRTPSGRS